MEGHRIVSLRVAERYAEDIGLGGEVEQRLAKITEGLNQRADRLLGSLNIDGKQQSRSQSQRHCPAPRTRRWPEISG